MRRVLALLAVAGIAGLLLTGCGSSGAKPLSKADYVKQMTVIGKSLSTSLSALGSATSAKAAAASLTKVQTDMRAAVDKLDAMTPPKDVATPHDQLSKAVATFADELSPVITKLKAGNLTALASVTSLKGLTDIQTAANAIQKAGYAIGG